MRTVTLRNLENKETLNYFIEFAKEQDLKGSLSGEIFKISLMKQRGLTRSAALKVMKSANISF